MSVRTKLFHWGLRVDQWLAASPLLRRSSGRAKTVFFPGCSLAGYNPSYVFAARDFIRGHEGECGVFMACCAKPLKLIGERTLFQRRIDLLRRRLDDMGAETVVTACQNCFKILRTHDKGRNVVSLWPLMLERGLPAGREGRFSGMEASLQDSCAMGAYPKIGAAARDLLKRLGVTVREMEFSGSRAKCCGGITMITTGDARIGREAMRTRAAESPCSTILSYCASCRSAMSVDGSHISLHLLDLIFGNGEPSRKGSNLLNRWRTARFAGHAGA
ncbi:MAG: (Fe-S)-binding protein [Synergistaceae bacterium]|nr:(Fe-S)-binding protein [Synergistaceae bacterium]